MNENPLPADDVAPTEVVNVEVATRPADATSEADTASKTVSLTRRDLVEVERLAGQPFGKLFPDGESTALGSLAAQYVLEKKQNPAMPSFDDWMDLEVEVEIGDSEAESGSGENPT